MDYISNFDTELKEKAPLRLVLQLEQAIENSDHIYASKDHLSVLELQLHKKADRKQHDLLAIKAADLETAVVNLKNGGKETMQHAAKIEEHVQKIEWMFEASRKQTELKLNANEQDHISF